MRWRWCLRKTSCSSWLSPSPPPPPPSNDILREVSLSLSLATIHDSDWTKTLFNQSQSRHFGSRSSGTQGKGKGKGGSAGASPVTRDWLAKLWKDEIKLQWKKQQRLRGAKPKLTQEGDHGFLQGFSTFQLPFFNNSKLHHEQQQQEPTSNLSHSTPPQQGGNLSAQRKLESLLSRNNLVIARDIEWANVLFAFEQESRYVIMDAAAPDSPVGFIRETSNIIYRQLLRSRRPFVAHIIDSHGNEIFRVRRPFWLINSTIFAEVDGKEIGVVHRRWHLWRRIYDLYLGNRQFAVVENPGFWNWTFTLKDEEDNVLAAIDRNWRGIGLELFTDAGQYVIRFGASGPGSYGSDYHIEELNVVRPLTLSERAVALALAVSLDCDYFSRRGGWGLPIMVLEE
ncbi:hypothetical protein LUZ61_004461 [Rhynchospora tenuis]|uniref:Phospholipid scramblase n=1 Tax=Rhynchospora tenuis TaxID=198213 RepID=A0AAD5ZMP6_9POAL|nr:hypothetical protein LUZ61_004461 [Rhynchospora tenuis]